MKYPVEARTPELQTRIECKIQRMLEAHQAQVEATQPPPAHVVKPPSREQGRSMTMGF